VPKLSLEQRIHKALNRTIEFEGTCFRLVSQQFANQRDVISSEGSKKYGGRFNFKGMFGVLYLSCDVHTGTEEATRATQAAEFDVAERLPCTTVGIKIKLSRILDLTNSKVCRAIGIRKSVLIQTDWEQTQKLNVEAITQSIGRFAKEAGFEAILVPSAVWKKGKNLDIFPDNLLPSSQASVVNLDSLQLS
jgi:RES domain-containing protein